MRGALGLRDRRHLGPVIGDFPRDFSSFPYHPLAYMELGPLVGAVGETVWLWAVRRIGRNGVGDKPPGRGVSCSEEDRDDEVVGLSMWVWRRNVHRWCDR